MNNKISFLRAVEMTIEPPFNFLLIADNNYYGKVKTCKSLSTAKKIGESLYLDGKSGTKSAAIVLTRQWREPHCQKR